jgi:type II secretory pathway pseudopilin PulG
LLAAVGLACLVLAVRGWQGWQRRNRRWQAVQRELTALRAQSQTQSQNSPGWFSQLNALLKRAARDSYPLQPVAAMSGSDWVAFLQKTFLQKNSNNAVDAELVNSLVNACWQPHSSCDPQQALAFAGRWLQDHKKQLRGAP